MNPRHLLMGPLLVLALMSNVRGDDAAVTAFVQANVLTMLDDQVLPAHTLLIRGDTIVAIGPSAELTVPDGATIIDASGQFLMPGLIDAHIHVIDPRDLTLHIAHGVTTVQNMAGSPLVLQWREQVAAGSRLGPTILSSGPMLERGDDPVADFAQRVMTPDEARSVIPRQAASGYDSIKIHAAIPPDAFDVLMEEADALGMRVIGHIPAEVGLQGVLDGGIDEISHIEEYVNKFFDRDLDASRIGDAVRLTADAGVPVVTTLVVYDYITRIIADDMDGLLERDELAWIDPARQLTWGPDANMYRSDTFRSAPLYWADALEFQQQLALAFQRGGVTLVLGTDAGGQMPSLIPGMEVHRELELLVEAGLSPYEALSTATRNAGAHLFGSGVGVLEAGARADLLLLDANPLQSITNTRGISGVMSRGRWFASAEVSSLLDGVAGEHERFAGFMRSVESEGVERAAEVIDGEAPDPAALIMFGYVMAMSGQSGVGTELLAYATEAHPSSYLAPYMLGNLLVQGGESDKAKALWRLADQRAPGHADIERRLQR